ncbi:MAG: PEP-CTERM sorting domain-containing protein [Planctomycetaceae bacterium]|nr:PEP-CTERM sorting domain-containing protein [Planctomycetaceae bacterium]
MEAFGERFPNNDADVQEQGIANFTNSLSGTFSASVASFPVAEPASLWLLAIGLILLVYRRPFLPCMTRAPRKD